MRRRLLKKSTESNPGFINSKGSKRYTISRRYISYIIGIVCFVIFVRIGLYFYNQSLSQKTTHNSQLLLSTLYDNKIWGTFRPQLYFGLRTRHPKSPLFGLVWYQQPRQTNIESLTLRHWCEHEDNVQFMWEDCDGKSFGHQTLRDDRLKFDTDWFNHNNSGKLLGPYSWSARINVQNTGNNSFAFIIYFVLQDDEANLELINELTLKKNYKILSGNSKLMGKFSLSARLHSSKNKRDISDDISYVALQIDPTKHLTQINNVLLYSLKRVINSNNFQLMNNVIDEKGLLNFIAIQFTVSVSTVIEIHYDCGKAHNNIVEFTSEFQNRLSNFQTSFNQLFPIVHKDKNTETFLKHMGKVALSNLLGGIGYWYGNSLMKSKYFLNQDEHRAYGPLSLFSAVPSRPFFPRGFLWDEGFHNLLIRKFDPILTLEIISSWLDTMNLEGWIPREIIIGTESQAKVPSEFLIQSDSVANPPVFFYLIEKFLNNNQFMIQYSSRLKKLYPKLKLWYLWLKSSQVGPHQVLGAFQWQGRNSTTVNELNPKTLPSGLDDYPRASHPSKEEYHLDLRCWMAVASRVLRVLSEQSDDIRFTLEVEEDIRIFTNVELLEKLHWSEKMQRYCDYGLHSDNVRLKKISRKIKGKNQMITETIREVLTPPKLGLVENAYGYISLFPFLLKLLPANSPKLLIILRSLNQSSELWTPFGLRSLSTHSPYYMERNTEHEIPYWRGPVWINMNYLALDALKHYSAHKTTESADIRQLSQDLYDELKWRVIKNIAYQFKKTGFFWENYNDKTGNGQGTRPFTGWTALVLNIMTDDYN